jgi:hypothetical protein
MGFPRRALANVEPFHAGKERQRLVTYLRHGGKLPIRLTARNSHSKVSGHSRVWSIKPDPDGLTIEEYFGSVKGPELFGTGDEFGKLRYVEDQLVEELDEGVAETRRINSGNEVLQVLACAFEEKNGESGENSAFEWRWT